MTPASQPAMGTARPDNLALIFQEVLTAIVRLRSNRQELSDAETFRYSMREAIKNAIQEARNRAGYSPEDLKMATLALVGFLDESVLNTRNPLFADWPRKPLQEELFGIHMAGEVFFQNLERLLGRPDSEDLADVLEIYCLCLMLGFAGRYSLGGRGELQSISTATFDRIRRIRGNSGSPFMEFLSEAETGEAAHDPWAKRFMIGAAACFALAAGLFVTFKVVLGAAASDVIAMATQAKR